jgi:hypothetical protein
MPEETEQLVTVKIDSDTSAPVKIQLDGGRRTEAAYVAPPGTQQALEEAVAVAGTDQVMNQLRSLADPEVTEVERGMRGDTASTGRPALRPSRLSRPASHEKDTTLYQNRVSSFVANSLEVTAQAVLAADRQSVRVSLTPVYNPAAPAGPARVVSPVFPGSSAK